MLQKNDPAFICCGRSITHQEINQIQETVSIFSNLSRKELAQTICEHLNWHTPAGANKIDACIKMLEKLEDVKIVRLPAKRAMKKPKQTRISISSRTDPKSETIDKLDDFSSVHLEIAKDKERVNLWNEYVMRYHYLGYKKPFGYTMRYFIKSDQDILGCILFSGASKSIGVRDRWIGWTENQRLKNLAWVINNSRFLLFPWVKIKNLISYIWGRIFRNIQSDWERRWGFSPALMETFVDPRFYHGSSYQASNWKYLGMTTGEGLVRNKKSYKTSRKNIYIKPLVKDFRRVLCSEKLIREVRSI